MGLFMRALVAAGVAAVLLPSTGAARTWGAPVLFPEAPVWSAALAPLPAAGALLAYPRGYDGVGVRLADGSDAGSLLGPGGMLPSLASDDAGEVVIAWIDGPGGSVDVSVRGRDGSFAATAAFAAAVNYTAPRLSVSPGGWAAVALPVDTADGQRMFVSVRPPGGAFAVPQEVAPAGPGEWQVPSAVAIDDSGEVVAGYSQDGVAHVAVRTPGEIGAWQPPQALGAPFLDLNEYQPLPLVAIAADGGAVAVWEEGGGTNVVAPVWASFRPPAGRFAAPQDLGVDTWDGGHPNLAVSAAGEVILTVEPAVPEVGGVGTNPLVVLSGSTALGRFGAPEQLSDGGLLYSAQLAMNARGDAVVVYVSCCSERVQTRRRAPFGSFEPAQDLPLPAGTSAYSAYVDGLAVDPFGNATLVWVDNSSGAGQPLISADGPVLAAAPDVVAPTPARLTDLAPPPIVPLATWWPFPVPASDTPAPPSAAGAARPGRAPDGSLALAVPRLPAATGAPRIVVAVSCPWACRASVVATLVTPEHRRLTLPRVVLTADVAGVVTAPLRLTSAATRALKVAAPRRRSPGRVTHPRRFTLNLTAAAGDRTGAPQTVSVKLSFVRR